MNLHHHELRTKEPCILQDERKREATRRMRIPDPSALKEIDIDDREESEWNIVEVNHSR